MATDRQAKPNAVSNYFVKISFGTGIDERFWSKLSGGKVTYGTAEYSDGQSNIKYQLPTTVSFDDITLSKPMTVGDYDLVAKFRQANFSDEFISVDAQEVKRNGFASENRGQVTSYQYCTVKSISYPEVDTSGDAIAMLEVVLSPGYVKEYT